MGFFNKVFLLGNLTRDPAPRALPRGSQIVEFGLAVNRRYQTSDGLDHEETIFVDCVAFGKQAEVLSRYCKRGRPLFVEGRLKQDQWEDKATGQPRCNMRVQVEHFQFVGGHAPVSEDAAPTVGKSADARSNDTRRKQWRTARERVRVLKAPRESKTEALFEDAALGDSEIPF